MNASEVFGTALRLIQHIENLMMQSVVNQRSRNLLSVLIEQLRNEILIRIQAFKNRIDLMQRMGRTELAGHESEREVITSNYNRIRQRCGSIDRRKTSPNIDKNEQKVEKVTIKHTQNKRITDKAGNRREFEELGELELDQRKQSANEHMKAIKHALNSTQNISELVEGMAALNINDME